MNQFNKILIALDNSPMDEELMESAKLISDLNEGREIHFINIIKDFETPGNLLRQFPNIIEGALKERKDQIAQKVNRIFPEDGNTQVKINVVKGNILKEILSYSSQIKSDLIIVGRKNERKGGGILNSRLARRANCSLMIIPNGTVRKVEKILIPIDFSENSIMALQIAAAFGKKNNAKIITQNVYQVPVGYHYSGKTKEEFAKVMEKNAKEDFDKLTRDIDFEGVDLEQVYTQSDDDHIMEDVYQTAKILKVDSVIIGAKGRTAATAIFIGSRAEKLIQIDESFPLIIMRPKGKNAGFIDYLKEL